MTITAISPANGQPIKVYREMTPDEVETVIQEVDDTFAEWRRTSFKSRAKLMQKAAKVLREGKNDYARLMAEEMGKPIRGGIAEAEKCAWVCDYYAENAEAFLADELVDSDASRSYVTYRPLGVVLAVMPWNFPFWQVFRFAAPGLMAGNVAVLKHASNVPGCALAIESVFERAGFPEGAFRTLLIGHKQVETVIENPRVKACTLTGSTPAGRSVAGAAGKALKKSVLELGGSDPYLILEDADLEKAAATCAASRLINSGQSCIAAKRFIVSKPVKEEFTDLLIKEMKVAKLGDPLSEETTVGPQARADLRDDLHRQVTDSVRKGAEVALGCEVPEDTGAYYPPSVLVDVHKGMPAFDEELFGPVAAIITAEDERHAIELANDTDFGLGAAVFTQDLERGEWIASKQLEAGCCFVNAFVKSDPRLPFGGIKQSGYGRELGRHGIREFVNTKTVYIA
jgi:succinate-semialdehyde dehydrogenase/glutarate-semialdehyde dehydrogenase